MEKKSVLVAGGAGFIGAHLVEALVKQGYYPIVIDNLSTGRMWRFNDIDPEDYQLIIDNVDGLALRTLSEIRLKTVQYELAGVINLTCSGSAIQAQSDMFKTLDTCYVGTRELLNIAKAFKVQYLHASSSEVYGEAGVAPIPETHAGYVPTTGIRAAHAEGNRIAETMVATFAGILGTECKIVRVFNPYGPTMNPDDSRVIPSMIMRGIQGKSIVIKGDGQQVRTFTYIDDAVDGILKTFEKSIDELPIDSVVPTFNIAGAEEISIYGLATQIQEMFTKESGYATPPLDTEDAVVGDIQDKVACIAYAKQLLGYEPKVSLSEGLTKTLKYYEDAQRRMLEAEKELSK